MIQTPTLQQLAHFAHARFGEGGPSFESGGLSSFDMLLRMFTREPGHIDEDLVALHASILLREWLQRRSSNGSVSPEDVDTYVQLALSYMRFLLSDPSTARDELEILSLLFRRHLEEAMLGRSTATAGAPVSATTPEETYVVTCTCGFTMHGADEEEVYRLVRGHIDGLHPEWHQPQNIQVAETVTPGRDWIHKAIIGRLEDEVINTGNMASIAGFAAPDQAEKLKERFTLLRTGFPDLHAEVEDMVANGEDVAVRSTLEGTHRGEIFGIAPTGKRVRVESFDFFRIVDERIVAHWGGIAELDLLQQLGLVRERVLV